MDDSVKRLEKKAFEIRKRILEVCIKAGTGHLTSSYSCVDVLVALYFGGVLCHDPKNPQWEERDRFILSKGQASPALYTVLADAGYFDPRDLDRFAQAQGRFGVHLQNSVPGVEITAGSLGQGFGIAAGMALAAKKDRALHFAFALLGDGECYEGSVWETAMFAAHNNLNNLVAIVDRNFLCATDFTEDMLALEPMEEKWRSFGWNAVRIDGHSIPQILEALKDVKTRPSSRPLVVVADTVKGEGLPFCCNRPLWHAVAPQGDDAQRARCALAELARRRNYD